MTLDALIAQARRWRHHLDHGGALTVADMDVLIRELEARQRAEAERAGA